MNSRQLWTVAVLCAGLAGCGQQGVPVPTDRFHRLMIESPATVYPTPRLPGVLEVERFSADGVLQGRSIIFVDLYTTSISRWQVLKNHFTTFTRCSFETNFSN